MQPRTTLILLVVALGLGAFVYFYEIRGEEQRQDAERRAEQLFSDVQAEDVEGIWFRATDGEEIHLERQEGGWQIVEPLRFPADSTAVDTLARSLAEIASVAEIEKPQPEPVYALEPGSRRTVRFVAGGQEHELRIGKLTPVGGNTYAATGDLGEGSPLYTVPTYRVTGFQKNVHELREKRLLPFEPGDIQRIEASWPDGGVVLVRDASGPWRLVEPLEAEVDGATVESLLSDLRFLRATDFLDDPDAEAIQQMEKTEFRAVLEAAATEGEEPRRLEVAIGGLYRSGRVARSSSQKIVYTVAPERLEDLPRSVVAYRFKALASFSILEAKQVELAFQVRGEDLVEEAVVIVAERGEQGWSSSPERFQPGKVSRLVSELSRLEARDIVADSMDEEGLAALGLSPPRTVLRVFGASDADDPEAEPAVLAEIHLGDADAEQGIAARRADRSTVFRLANDLAEHVPISLDAFRNRFVSQEEPVEEEGVDPEAETSDQT